MELMVETSGHKFVREMRAIIENSPALTKIGQDAIIKHLESEIKYLQAIFLLGIMLGWMRLITSRNGFRAKTMMSPYPGDGDSKLVSLSVI